MTSAGWHAADRITLASGWRDAASILLDRPYPSGPDEHAFPLRPAAGPRVRARRRPEPPPAPPRPAVADGRVRLDRRRDLRPVGRRLALHGRGHAPHRPGRRPRAAHALRGPPPHRDGSRGSRSARPSAEPSKAATAAATATGPTGGSGRASSRPLRRLQDEDVRPRAPSRSRSSGRRATRGEGPGSGGRRRCRTGPVVWT